MKAYWIIGIVMAAALPVHAEDCSVDVYVTTGVAMRVPHLVLTATAMFREIGVNVRIQMRSLPRDVNDHCGDPIVVQLENSTGYPGTTNALAYATPYKESGPCIHIFLDRVARSNREPGFADVLLAHVMVHEITHVLEQSIRHSEDGVMKARWSYEDYQRMKSHPLPFASEDVECVREGVSKRIAHAVGPNMAHISGLIQSSRPSSSP